MLFEGVAVGVGGRGGIATELEGEVGVGSESLQSPRVPGTKPAVRSRRWWKPVSCAVCDTRPCMNDGHDSGEWITIVR